EWSPRTSLASVITHSGEGKSRDREKAHPDCDTVTVLGSKRHCQYACSAAPSSCWFPVLVTILAPVTLPVSRSIVTKTTPFPVSPCFACSARYAGLRA